MSTPPPPVEQRLVRPFSTEPGHWKKQLPTRALNIAIKGDLAGLKRLLAETPSALNHRGPHGRTLLWEAARRGHVAAVEWLLAHGAEVNATGSYNAESFVQITPYVAAVFYRRPAVAPLLRAAGATEDIFRAAFLGAGAQVAALLAEDPARLHAEDENDEIYYVPPLGFAVAGGQLAQAADLIGRGAAVARYSALLIRIAVQADYRDLLAYLLAHGADARAADSGVFEAAADLEVMRTLLAHGAPVNGADGANGFPPLVFAARGDKGEHPEKLALLLAHGAAVNATGRQGRTALHYAAAAGHQQAVSLLLRHGADKTLPDAAGQTARDLARQRGHKLRGL